MRLFRKKSFIERTVGRLGHRPKPAEVTAIRSGLITLGSAAGLAALSAVVSGIRARQEAQDDQS